MSQQPSDNQTFELIKFLITWITALATFSIGLVAVCVRNWWSRRRELNNIRSVFLQELKQNQYRLKLMFEKLDLTTPGILNRLDIHSLAHGLTLLSVSVFHAYRDRVYALEEPETSSLFYTYYQIEMAFREADAFKRESQAAYYQTQPHMDIDTLQAAAESLILIANRLPEHISHPSPSFKLIFTAKNSRSAWPNSSPQNMLHPSSGSQSCAPSLKDSTFT